MLFDQDIERTRSDGKRHDEGDFDYMNVSGRLEAAAVRDLLESWLADYPSAHHTELFQRLRHSDQQFASASFELFPYTVLARLGWTIEVHPDIPSGNGKRPDFRVRTDSGDAFYLEVTVAGAFSAAEFAAEQRKNEVLHAIDDLHSPHFLLDVQVEGNPPTPVPRRKLRHQLRKWLESLAPQEVEKQIRGERHWEEHQYEHDGWIIRFRAIPRAKPAEAGRRTIGAWSTGVRTVNIVEAVKDAAKGKASRYGALDLPFVVAINVEEEFADSSQERDAFLGMFNTGYRAILHRVRCSQPVYRMAYGTVHAALNVHVLAGSGFSGALILGISSRANLICSTSTPGQPDPSAPAHCAFLMQQ
ncbi:hypothetical protein [Achromobacter insuavis]|uniref:hypothetical protein n=1 Tax=Achromobacter insuavis TaxID=1287735 RepID=UPI001F13E17D|nr:hypothetical protein [Achromobacter insuavis]